MTEGENERRHLMSRRRDDFEQLDRKVDEEFETLREWLRGIIHKALIAFALIGITSAVALAGFGLLLRAFQNQRYNVFVTNCQESNQHHEDLFHLDDVRIARLPIADRKRALKASAPYRNVINVAFPYRKDCKSYAKARLRGGHE